jgi:hypothetical protein
MYVGTDVKNIFDLKGLWLNARKKGPVGSTDEQPCRRKKFEEQTAPL